MRWATTGGNKDSVGSFAVGLACWVGVICAFGQVGEPFQFGVNALAYGVGIITFGSLFFTLFLRHPVLRMCAGGLLCFVWVWVMTGMTTQMDMFIKALLAGSVLLVLSLVFTFKMRAEFTNSHAPLSWLITPLVLNGTLAGFAFYLGDQMAGHFAISLVVVVVGAIIWGHDRTPGVLSENAVFPISLCTAALVWDMWLQGHLPLLSIFCFVLVLFSHHGAERVLNRAPVWLQKSEPLVRVVVSLLPIGLSIVFFDILRSL
ncbi:hypothetical protein GCM10011332_12150 [Terasakiella brassicae]|uniref:Uncharacterized protein n=1 Tax=Terasakiella brassicae TaxID=1634917 RepID=A0A917BV93_9PROT|nr:hypothetical protein GCM10011332_12150 [Terasakiella brassicae]